MKEVKKSSMANMKNGGRFLGERNITPALLKLETFIDKVRNDISKDMITESAGNNLINETTRLINMIRLPEEG
jgi:hypothetical protein